MTTTEIVVANRNGLAAAPDGSKHRLVRGRTLADARHPLAQAHPDLFSPYTIDLPYDGTDADGYTGPDAQVLDDARASLEEAQGTAEGYRAQLAAIAEGLHTRGLVPADVDTGAEGWLAALVFATIDGPPAAAEDEPEPPELPTPARKRAPRRAATARAEE